MKSFIVLLIAIGFSWRLSHAQDNCNLKIEKDWIRVYTCSTDSEKLKSLKANFNLPGVTVKQLGQRLLAVQDYTKWQYRTIESALIESISDHEVIYRTELSAPWPVANREMIAKLTIHVDTVAQTLSAEMVSVKSDYPQDEDLVRVPSSVASWTVMAKDNVLFIEYKLKVDPGGSIPTWLINTALAEGPFDSFSNLRRITASK